MDSYLLIQCTHLIPTSDSLEIHIVIIDTYLWLIIKWRRGQTLHYCHSLCICYTIQ